MGKSELLKYWLHTVAIEQNLFEHILYLDCSDGLENAFENSYVQHALGIQADDPHKLQTAVINLLPFKENNNILLVLDDLPWQDGQYEKNKALFQKHIARSVNNIIATSRRSYERNFQPIPINKLEVDDALLLFVRNFENDDNATLDNTDEEEKATISEIVKRAGWHTLTIEILAKTAYEEEWSIQELLATLSAENFDYSHLKTDVEYDKDDECYQQTLSQALRQLFDLTALTDSQKQILYHLSCTNSQQFSLNNASEWLAVAKSDLTKLYKLGWLQQNSTDKDKSYQLHQSISHAVYSEFIEKLDSNQRFEMMSPVAERMEHYYRFHNNYNIVNCLSVIGYYFNSLLKQSDTHDENIKIKNIDRLNDFAKLCMKTKHYYTAKELLETNIQNFVQLIGVKTLSISIIDSLNILAEIYGDLSNYEKALLLYQEVKELIKLLFGKNFYYIKTINNLADIYRIKENFEMAISFYEESSDLIRELFSEKSVFYSNSLNNLANLYKNKGEYEKSLSLYHKSEEVLLSCIGEFDQRFPYRLNNLAHIYEIMGNDEKALYYYQSTSDIIHRHIGKNNEYYITSLEMLADFYRRKKNYEESINLNEQAMEITKSLFGEEHHEFATSLQKLANNYKDMGKYEQAVHFYEKAKTIEVNYFGNMDIHITYSLNNLAVMYGVMKEYEKAIPLYKQVNEIILKFYGKYNQKYTSAVIRLSEEYENMDDYKRALTLYEEEMQITKTIFGTNHTHYFYSLCNVARVNRRIGNYENALLLYQDAIKIALEFFEKQDPITQAVLAYIQECKNRINK